MTGCGEMDCSVSALASKLTEIDACATDPSIPTNTPECAICLQRCVHPVCLPCSHVFCFLCVKGASWHSKRCALCRQEIPEDFLERPVLLLPEELKAAAAGTSQGAGTEDGPCGDFAWYYEGRNGWWQYDERTSHELEEAFSKGRKSTEMQIAGFLYVADLENMVQYRRNEHGRRRKIKRDVVDIPKKGVAGLRLDPEHIPIPALPVLRSADGSDAAGQSHSLSFGLMASLPPVRPPTLLGLHVTSPPSASTLEDSFSQLLISQPEEEEEEEEEVEEEGDGDGDGDGDENEDDESQSCEDAVGGSEIEEAGEGEGATGEMTAHRRHSQPQRESQLARMPPRGGASSSALSVRSRSPDGQCTVTEV